MVKFGSTEKERHLTKRAPDLWESAAFSGIFLASSFFYISSLFLTRPKSANANRWATPSSAKVIIHI